MPKVVTRAGPLAYDEAGTGPSLLLLAPGSHSRRDWDLVRPALAERFRTVAVDWPGHGDSPPPPASWAPSAPAFADVVVEVVDALGLAPVLLMGNSVGGFAAARLAITRPELVRALVLVDPGGFAPATPVSRAFCAAMGRPGFLRVVYPSFARWYLRSAAPAARRARETAAAIARRPGGTEVVAGLWRSFAGRDHDLRAGRITVPTLLVWGRRDPVIPVAVGRRLARSLPQARLVELDAGHLPFVTRPEEFSAAVGPFLESVTRLA